MGNVILKVQENLNPKDGDLLIYNSSNDYWEVTTKLAFLSDNLNRIKELETENESLQNEVKNLKSDISKIAKIIKEKIQ